MPENPKPVRVAVNVMRARLTVIGFNIAIVSFQIVNLYGVSGGLRVPGVDHAVHVGADMALFMALALSLIALVAFIMSSAFDEAGYCTHWSLVAGDLLMYLALAHTVAGFFAPLTASIEIFSAKLPDHASEISILHTASLVAGAAVLAYLEKIAFTEALYFAFVTGMTIGYGDIVMHTPVGRLVALLIGLVGILFTGLMVAVLVHAVRESFEESEKRG